MQVEITIVSNLVKALDDARLFCVDAGVHATRPWLKRVLEQLAQTHLHVADELCALVARAGGGAIPRDACRRRTWRASWLGWVARNHFDSELVYIQQARKYEDRLTRRFARAVRRTSDGDIHWRLQRHLYEIDHARMKLARVAELVQEEVDARWLEGDASTPAPATTCPPRAAAHERSHVAAGGGSRSHAGLHVAVTGRQLH